MPFYVSRFTRETKTGKEPSSRRTWNVCVERETPRVGAAPETKDRREASDDPPFPSDPNRDCPPRPLDSVVLVMDAPPSSPPAPSSSLRRGRPLSPMVRYTWSRHWPAEALMGASGGMLGLTAFCLQRSMGAPGWTSPALVVLGQGLWVLAPAWPA